jgi:hypothetical protein
MSTAFAFDLFDASWGNPWFPHEPPPSAPGEALG